MTGICHTVRNSPWILRNGGCQLGSRSSTAALSFAPRLTSSSHLFPPRRGTLLNHPFATTMRIRPWRDSEVTRAHVRARRNTQTLNECSALTLRSQQCCVNALASSDPIGIAIHGAQNNSRRPGERIQHDGARRVGSISHAPDPHSHNWHMTACSPGQPARQSLHHKSIACAYADAACSS